RSVRFLFASRCRLLPSRLVRKQWRLEMTKVSIYSVVAVALGLGSMTLKADVTGSILGVVRDPTAAVIAGAMVVATNLDTNQSQTTTSDALGQYRLLALPVGKYRLEATSPGFQKFLESGIALDVNEQKRIDVTLTVGSVDQQVEVNATAVQVETTNTQLGQVVDQKKLVDLPLNGRSYIDLLGLQPGVAPTTAGTIQQDRPVSGGLSSGN